MPDMPDMPDIHALLSASLAARYARVSVQAIVNWRTRGYCLPDGTRAYLEAVDTPDGKRYRLIDVARAEHATRKRARRTASC